MKIEELIEKVSAATGPDRQLDVEIAIATCVVDSSINPRLVREMRQDEDDHGWVLYEYDGENFTDCAKSFSSSFDAALSLVPENNDWIVGSVNGQIGGTPYACVGSEKAHYAETPVLSLVLAALHARVAATSRVVAA